MTIPRRLLVAPDRARFYHLTSRCVRGAFLCGRGLEHRKAWIHQRLRFLVGILPVEIAACAIMTNHLHLVVRFDPTAAVAWTADEVVRRWCRLHPRCLAGLDNEAAAARRAQLAAKDDWVAQHRSKLAQLGLFMRELKYWLARRANREDESRGHFWESRYTSIPLLDQAALTAAMAYVDLNPVRAKMAEVPEEGEYTSIRERIQALKGLPLRPAHGGGTDDGGDGARAVQQTPAGERHPYWLMPLGSCRIDPWGEDRAPSSLAVQDYLQLVDRTGRQVRQGKRGSIDPAMADILRRLGLDDDRWAAMMRTGGQICGTALGLLGARVAEARRRAIRWVANRCALFAVSTEDRVMGSQRERGLPGNASAG